MCMWSVFKLVNNHNLGRSTHTHTVLSVLESVVMKCTRWCKFCLRFYSDLPIVELTCWESKLQQVLQCKPHCHCLMCVLSSGAPCFWDISPTCSQNLYIPVACFSFDKMHTSLYFLTQKRCFFVAFAPRIKALTNDIIHCIIITTL